MYNTVIVLVVLGLAVANGQRVAPGVPPQHYQQPPAQYQQQQQQYQQHPQQHLPPGVNPQQYQQQQQQQQMQYQQVPVQQQQVPVHQQQQVPVHQQQVPVQQVPQGHGGGHHAPHGHHGQQQVLNAANIQHEREHIQEHMQVPIDTSKMSEAELQFHYFKMHDSDNNNKLDGCELIKSLIHWHVDENGNVQKTNSEGTGEKNGAVYTDENLADVIDYVLNTMDLNKDGYVDYTEYRKSEEGSSKGNKQ
ncbi:lymphotoxin beta receptor inhibitor isoform 3-T3 [Cochliomyia hominivorax]